MKIPGIFLLLIVLTTCNTTDPPVDKAELLLKLENVSCTEAWITLTFSNIQLPAEINLIRTDAGGDSVSQISVLTTQDSLLYVDSLLPNQTYLLKAASTEYGVMSSEISVTTMDTTSHNFTFESWTFGDIGSSTLYDVAIISEDNIWCVGDIEIADTSVNGYTTYSYLKWNGIQWERGILKYFPPGSSGDSITTRGRSIFAFNENDVWISGGAVFHWDGSSWKTFYNTGAEGSNKIWGTSSNNLYFVGNNGNIAHYNGSPAAVGWTRIESGTNLNINDIWGDYNEKKSKWEILAVGGNILHGSESERVILKINGNQVKQISAEGTQWPLRTVWFKQSNKYYVAGSGIYEKHNINQNKWGNDVYDISTYSINKLRGEFLNNIAATGGAGELVYFNGFRWQSYIVETMLQAGNFRGLAIKGDLIIAVGQNSPQAVVTLGKRNN